MSEELSEQHYKEFCPALAELWRETIRVSNGDYSLGAIRNAERDFKEARRNAEWQGCQGPELREEDGVTIAYCSYKNQKWPLHELPARQQEGILHMNSLRPKIGKTAIQTEEQ